ncbi:hypothetical protein [Pseudonocardia sp. GCM10023141]|uniref:hypothetical protein n=1 Tax=Pseudonocardia sp. GCM10023141 TaxID=3252653 RepID=UPI00360F739A
MLTDAEHTAALARITFAIDACDEYRRAALAMPHTCEIEHAFRAERLALIHARRAGWWIVLARLTRRAGSPYRIYRTTALMAAVQDRGSARFWRDASADWFARFEDRPTSDAAGALSNWHELGVTA